MATELRKPTLVEVRLGRSECWWEGWRRFLTCVLIRSFLFVL